jgi:hypothetical protein
LQGSVLFVGDSTIRMDIYELWASLSTHTHEPVDGQLLAAKSYISQFNTRELTSGANHNKFVSRETTVGTRIAYHGYYWASEDLANVWDTVFDRAIAENYTAVVYNLGFHLLWESNYKGWQNSTSLARYDEHLAVVTARAIAANITLILVGTNPLCPERIMRGPSSHQMLEHGRPSM